MSRWQQFFREIQQDLKLYIYMLGVFSLLRIGFIAILHSYLNSNTTFDDLITALYYGLRISLKSAGVITLLSFLLCTLPAIFFTNDIIRKNRYFLGSIYIFMLSILFQIRIPYYEQFHVGFNQFMFNALHDDMWAIFLTFIQHYNLFPKVAIAIFITLLLIKGLHLVLHTKTLEMPLWNQWYKNLAFRILLLCGIFLFMVFTRWGGSFNYPNSINWENFGRTQDEFLNEAILDDIQALTRAYRLHERVNNAKGLNIKPDQIHSYAQRVSNKEIDSDKLIDYLEKEAAGAMIPKPKQIFLVIAESYAQWPLMDKYEHVGIANGMKRILKQDNAIQVPAFIPDGPFTAMAVTGVVTGLANVHLYVTDEIQSFKQPYITAIAPQMKNLGYKTYFWYGGFSSWERIKDFTLAQGFDNFYSYGDFQKTKGTVWGVDDREFLQSISGLVNPEEWSFHVILTTSNHAPYTIQLQTVGFDASVIPERYRSNKDLVEVLGHFWYADKAIADFVTLNYNKNPDSLFIITGDHADRTNLDPNPTFHERYSVPCLIYGAGITKEMIPDSAAGNHIHIAPTLFELIAPQGFRYYSIGKSLTKGNYLGINHELWITPEFIGRIGNPAIQRLPWGRDNDPLADIRKIQEDIEAIRAVSWWQVKNGQHKLK